MKTSAPLLQSQYGLYVECVSHAGEVCYNLPYIYVLSHELDAERLCTAIRAAVAAHPVLFTRIELGDDGEPVQNVPRSVKEEGHKVLSLTDNGDGTYELIIQKVGD